MYIVTGVSGKTGSAVATALLQRGERIRVVVRSKDKGSPWLKRGAEVVITSFEDRVFADTFEGADAAYLVVPPNIEASDQVGWYRQFAEIFCEALMATPLPHAVVLSAWGANQPRPFPQLHKMEQTLQQCTTPITFLRASYFMENFQADLDAIRSQGVLASFVDPELKIPMVACRDIGDLGAELMTRRPQTWSAVDLTGPEDYSFADVARAYSKVLGRVIKTMRVPEDQIVSSIIEWGASRESAEFFREMYRTFERGEIWPEGGDVPMRRGHTRLEEQVRGFVATIKPAYLG